MSWDETWGLKMEEIRESEELKLAYMLRWLACFFSRLGWHSRETLTVLEAGITEWGEL